jgi:hypothetical protein
LNLAAELLNLALLDPVHPPLLELWQHQRKVVWNVLRVVLVLIQVQIWTERRLVFGRFEWF